MKQDNFGEAMKRLRIKQGMSAMELSEAVNCSYTNIKNIEDKGQMPRLDLAGRLLRALGVRLTIGHAESRKRLMTGGQ